MKSVLLFVSLVLVGCGNDSITNPMGRGGQPPAGATPAPPQAGKTAAVAGYVYSESGACLVGAVVEVLDGTRAGLKATQDGCGSPWDDANQGYFFELTANTNVRLRASKNGYQTRELVAVVDNQHQVDFRLPPE